MSVKAFGLQDRADQWDTQPLSRRERLFPLGVSRVPKGTSELQLTLLEPTAEADLRQGDRPKRPEQSANERRPDGTHGFAELAESFLTYLETNRRCSRRTLQAYRCDYQRIAKLLRTNGCSSDVRQISSGDLDLCIARLSHLSPASIQRIVYSLSSLFGHLQRRGIIGHNPVADVARPQQPHKLPKAFSRDQADQLMAACQTSQETLIIALLRYCGLRRNELLALDVGDVAADCSSIRVSGKGRKQRDIPLYHDLGQLLQDHIANLPDDGEAALLRNRSGRRMSPTSFYRLFSRLLARADLAETKLTPHGLRHQFGSELVRAGVDVATIAELMGHSNISVTSIYLHSDLATKRTAIAHLPPMGLQSTENEQEQPTHGWELHATTSVRRQQY